MAAKLASVEFGTVVSSGESGATSGFSTAVTVDNKSNRLLYVAIGTRDGTSSGDTAITACSFNSVAMTAIANDVVGGGGTTAIRMSTFYLAMPDIGTFNVSFTTAGAVAQAIVIAVPMYNINLDSSFDAATITDANTTTTEDVVPLNSFDRSVHLMAVINNITDGIVVTSSNTTTQNATVGGTIEMGVYSRTDTISPQITVTFTNSKTGMVSSNFRPRRRHSYVS